MTQQTNVRLKLLIDSKTGSVVYGEANKDFIDFLLNLLSLPLGAVIRLLKKEQMVGCLGNLYESVETLSEACFLSSQSKDTLLKPKVSFNCSTKLLPFINIDTSSTTSSSIGSSPSRTYVNPPSSASTCSQSSPLFGTSGFVFSPVRVSASTSTSQASDVGGGKVGFVKDLATYIVMDDLTVKHISDFSIVSLLKKLNIKDVDSLEEKVVTLNVDEGVEILKAALRSKKVLTNLFFRREREINDDNNDNDDDDKREINDNNNDDDEGEINDNNDDDDEQEVIENNNNKDKDFIRLGLHHSEIRRKMVKTKKKGKGKKEKWRELRMEEKLKLK